MTESLQPMSGSLEAKVIRACRVHNNKCQLDCPKRPVEDLGEIASFEYHAVPPSILDRLKEGLSKCRH